MGRWAFRATVFGLAPIVLAASQAVAFPSYLDVAYGPAQAGLEIGISIGSGRYLADSRVDVVFRTRNVSGAPVALPTLSKTLTAFVRDEHGKSRAVKSYCLDWYAIDPEPVIAADATRIEIVTLDLQCDGMVRGLFSLSFATGSFVSNAVAFVVAAGVTSSSKVANCDDPRLIRVSEPSYPESLRGVRASGVSAILVVLDEKGRVGSASVYESSGYVELDEAALAAARASTYTAPSAGCPPTFLFRSDFSTQ